MSGCCGGCSSGCGAQIVHGEPGPTPSDGPDAEFIFITQICDGGVGGEAMVEIPGYSPGEIPAGQSVLWDLGGATLVTGSLTDGSVIFSGGAGPYTITLTVYAGPNQTGASTSVSHDTIAC